MMQYQRVYKLPNLNDGVDIITDTGELITEQQLNETNAAAGKSGFAYQSAKATPEQIENHYLELLIDAYPDKLDTVETQAKELTNKYLGLDAPAQAQEFLRERVRQYAQPVQGTKGMSTPQFEKGLKERLKPWAQRKQNDGLQDDKAWWIGKDIVGFNAKADELERAIELADGSPASRLSIINTLRDKHGYGQIQATEEFDRVNSGESVAARRLGVPNASADEGINLYLMQASGADAENWNRGDPAYATDHMITLGDGTRLGVDSQRRMGRRAMKIGVLSGHRGAVKAGNSLRRSIALNEGTLREALAAIRSAGGREDKLLQSLGLDPSAWYRSKHDKIRKDLLISADMSDWTQHPSEADTFTAHKHGPYNPTLGSGWEMYDLRHLREDIMDRPIGDLEDMGITFRGDRYGKLSMEIPQTTIQRFANTSMLDPGIVAMARRLRR